MNKIDPKIPQTILNGLDTPIQPVERSGNYKIGMLGAATVMIFMMGSYIAMCALLFWIILNILFHFLFFAEYYGATLLFGFAFDVVVLVIAVSVLLALLKPLFVQRQAKADTFRLHPQQEPLFFEFVNRVCVAVGAPAPTEIVVDPHANAGAGFVSGVLDRRMVLTIGLPLVLSLNTRQLAGVVAHEFGHFTQASGMRLSYAVRAIDAWFYEAAFRRDTWDEQVLRLSHSSNLFVRYLFKAVWVAVWIARRILLGLVMAGHFFMARLLRQMEFDADRRQARLAGSLCFAQTFRTLRKLDYCHKGMIGELDHYRRTRRLPDDLPALLVDSEKSVDQKKFREAEEKLLNVQTHWSDTHPCDRDRIENVANENAAGTFTVEYPASVLFSDIRSLCQITTKQLYRETFTEKFRQSEVKDSGELIETRANRRTQGKAAMRFCLEQFYGFETFILSRMGLGEAVDSESYRSTTAERRQQLGNEVRAYAKRCQQEDQIRTDMVKATCARRLIEAGFNMAQAEDVFLVSTIQQSVRKLKELSAQDQNLKQHQGPFRHVLGARLIDALEFLRSEQVAIAANEDPQVVDEIRNILGVWNRIVQMRQELDAFLFETHVNSLLLDVAEKHMDERVQKSLNAALARLTSTMIQIQQSTLNLMYPFEHGQGEVSLAHYLLPELPTTRDMPATISAASDLEANLDFLLKRCVARLGALAEKVEKAFGFEPLEPPTEVSVNR